MTVTHRTIDSLLKTSVAEGNVSSTQEYFVNMGPQHPIAHGSLRLVVKLDGETIREVIPMPGYVHRGIEKMCERLAPRQIIPMTDRMDYLSALMNNWCVAKTVEAAAGIQTNPRIETIRTIMAELMRLQSHLLWWGVLGVDMGAFTAFLYSLREREIIGEIFEETIGARLTMNYFRPGGLMFDIKPDFQAKVKKVLEYLKPIFAEYETLLSGNIILQERLRNIAFLDGAKAVALGCTGPVVRASGIPLDLRRLEPYGMYGKVEFNVPVGTVGDCWDRYQVRMLELVESVKIIEQLIDTIPEGPHMVMKYGVPIKIPEGIHYGQVETARGILGVTIVSDGKGKTPYRVHFRSPNFNNLWAVTCLAPGWRIADIIAIQSTLDLVIPDIDR